MDRVRNVPRRLDEFSVWNLASCASGRDYM